MNKDKEDKTKKPKKPIVEIVRETKKTIFVDGKKKSEQVDIILSELYNLKKPNGIAYKKGEEKSPFTNPSSFEFYCEKSKASQFVYGGKTKSGSNIIMGRVFGGLVSDMMDFKIEEVTSSKKSYRNGTRPIFLFKNVETDEHKHAKSLLLDLLNKNTPNDILLSGIELVISVTFEESQCVIKTYLISPDSKKKKIDNGTSLNTRDITLEETGFCAKLTIKRAHKNNNIGDTIRKAPKNTHTEKDGVGNIYKKIHTGRQNIKEIRPRKMKAFGHK
eukprot:GHVP01031504.1.p1 GENE.GHVP01031504.1~~GHVP01031504.1.p1  ORF type:complete len:274 (-),score=59.61 GHVP01031504.1:220-1041(-)